VKPADRYKEPLGRIAANNSDYVVAGEDYDGNEFARYQQLENCSFLFAWLPDMSPRWWAEVACAALKGRRVFVAEPGVDAIYSKEIATNVFQWAAGTLHDTRERQRPRFPRVFLPQVDRRTDVRIMITHRSAPR